MKKVVLVFLICYFFNGLKAQQTDILSIANSIDYDHFNKHLEFLSSDDLKGRDTGSEGYDKAANYVSDLFMENGLKPFGDDNTYFQNVPLLKQYINVRTISFYVENKSVKINAKYAENISFLINTDLERIDEKQQLVFVGYGLIDSSLNINDYEGLDVEGKTVIAALGAPKSFKDYASFDPFIRIKAALSQGAKGLILFYPKGLLQNAVYKQMHGFLEKPVITLNDIALKDNMFDFDLKIAAFAHKDYIKEVFKINNLNLGKELKKISKGENRSKILKGNAVCKYEIKTDYINCKNVVAVLPGEDDQLKNEYVVLGAHLDHIGISEPIKGDSICNGMWDNATGSATLISIAKAYYDASIKPKRSLVFVCYTGEEKGLLGSNYFVNRKEFKNGGIVANLNIDMLGGLFPTKDIIPMGYSHSNLSEAVDFSAQKLNYIIDDNKVEENTYLFRSDQASFLKVGVPVLNIANGYTAVDPKIDGEKEFNKWMKKYYHKPKDDLEQDYSKEVFHDAIKLSFLTTYYLTNLQDEINWNENSWIYKRFVLNQ